MMEFYPEKVFVEEAATEAPLTKSILEKLGQVEIVYIDDYRKIEAPSESVDGQFGLAKRNLALAVKKGSLVKEFRRHSCLKQAREYYLIHAANCPFDCAYCYLQSYYENAVPTIFVNTDDLFHQVEEALSSGPNADILFHAGETADALALEHLSGFAVKAVEFFANKDNACLELRTKSANVDNIILLDHAGRAIVSWTLTPREIIEKYEHDAASLEERLSAASRCAEAGYPIGLRFDPMIHYDGWRDGYHALVKKVGKSLRLEDIHSIMLGGFRFPPRLREIMIERRGRDGLSLGEFVRSPDGKMRYFRHIREEMYREMIKMLENAFGRESLAKVELAMEPEYIWKNAGLIE